MNKTLEDILLEFNKKTEEFRAEDVEGIQEIGYGFITKAYEAGKSEGLTIGKADATKFDPEQYIRMKEFFDTAYELGRQSAMSMINTDNK